MPQVSKKYIQQEREKKIYNILTELLVKIKNKKDAQLILNDLFTKTEKIMVSKRLACFYLLNKNVPIEDIADILKMSISTVYYYKDLIKTKVNLNNYLSNKVSINKIKQSLKDIFMEFYYNSPRKGSDWSTNKRIYYDYQRSKTDKL